MVDFGNSLKSGRDNGKRARAFAMFSFDLSGICLRNKVFICYLSPLWLMSVVITIAAYYYYYLNPQRFRYGLFDSNNPAHGMNEIESY